MSHIVIILAAGEGKRMKSDLPKVLHQVNNLPMIVHVIKTARETKPLKIVIMVGKHHLKIKECIQEHDIDNVEFFIQKEPKGTGHAVMCWKEQDNMMINRNTSLLILNGDVPLIKCETILNLLNNHKDVSVIVSKISNPFGYGRILTDELGNFLKIVEEKDCTNEEKKINLINSGIYLFNFDIIDKYLFKIDNKNASAEYYLTDLLKIIKDSEKKVDFNLLELSMQENYQISGVNNQLQLANLNKINEKNIY
tara:strand:+ start:1473 stop:2228 length:756 start_codon:yes stop_codon:yes gene_type:complete